MRCDIPSRMWRISITCTIYDIYSDYFCDEMMAASTAAATRLNNVYDIVYSNYKRLTALPKSCVVYQQDIYTEISYRN